MKKLLLLACMFPCLSFAQFQQKSHLLSLTPTLDSTYLYQGEEERLTNISVFTYNEQGRKQQAIHKVSNGDEMVVIGKIEYQYVADPKGECVEEQGFHFREDGTWVQDSRTLNYFNKSKKQYALEEYMRVNGEWKKTWAYNTVEFEGNNPKVAIDSTFKGDGSVSVTRIVAKYKETEYPDSSYNYNWDAENKEWLPMMRSKLTYDPNGNMTSQYSEIFQDGAWGFSFEFTYKYDERGNMTHEVDYDSFPNRPFAIRYQNFYSDKVVTHTDQVSLSDVKLSFNAASRTVHVDLGESQSGTLRLINISGIVVQQSVLNRQQSDLTISQLGKGYHIVVVETPKGVKSQAIIL